MTTVTAEQIAERLKARAESTDDVFSFADEDLVRDALAVVKALTARVEGLEGELARQVRVGDLIVARADLVAMMDGKAEAEARADALSAELEGLKKGSSSSRGALPSAVCPGGPDRPRPAGWRDMESAPQNGTRVLVDFSGAGPIVAFRDRDFPAMWVRYVGYGKSSRFPLVHEDYARGWMPLPSSEVQFISPNVVSAGNPATDTINTSQNHPSTNGEG